MLPDTVPVSVTGEQLAAWHRYTVTLPSVADAVPVTLTLLVPPPLPSDVTVTAGAVVSIVIARGRERAELRPPFDAFAVRLWTPSASGEVVTEYVPPATAALPTAVSPS